MEVLQSWQGFGKLPTKTWLNYSKKLPELYMIEVIFLPRISHKL